MEIKRRAVFIPGPSLSKSLSSKKALDAAETILTQIEKEEINNSRDAERRVDELIAHADGIYSRLDEQFLVAVDVHTRILRLNGLEPPLLRERETEFLERNNTNEEKEGFIETTRGLTEGTLRTRFLQEAKDKLDNLL